MTEGRDKLLACLERLVAHYDIDRWHWRDDTSAFDVCVGAVLVQHTAWSNVEKALAALRAAGISDVEALSRISEAELAGLIRPAGTPAVKARRLKALAALVRQ
ncbi:MAG TPA: endonuclease, partial [Dehalococcoidia bacterium]|nr:endonuclease [Dehalococcoidia bacterium]